MVPGSNVAGLCGLSNKDEYIRAIIKLLRHDGAPARRIRRAVMKCFGIDDNDSAQTHNASDSDK